MPGTSSTSSRLSGRLWLLFAVFIVYGCTIPFRFTADWTFVANKWAHLSWNPLISSETGGRPSFSDVVQNILLFVPFGALGVLAGRPSSRSILLRVGLVTGLAAGLSVMVEGVQLFTLDRVTSVTDVAADTLGALAGAMAAHLAQRLSARSLRAVGSLGWVTGKAFYPFLVASVVVCAAAWEPFDVTLDVGSVAHKVHALQHDVWQYGGLTDEGIAVIHYVLVAVAACAWLDTLGVRRAAAGTILVGVPLAAGLEASQIAISSRMPGLEDALVRAAGVLLGAVLWRVGRGVRASGVWLALLVVATAAAAAMANLSPFTLAPQYRTFGWLPFMGYYAHTTFDTVSHVIELWLLYFPLGFVTAVVVARPTRAVLTAVLVTVAIAAPIEYGQGWIVGRYPDITDIAMSALGGWLGAWVGTRGATLFDRTAARYPPRS
jgi:VanZ family protein